MTMTASRELAGWLLLGKMRVVTVLLWACPRCRPRCRVWRQTTWRHCWTTMMTMTVRIRSHLASHQPSTMRDGSAPNSCRCRRSRGPRRDRRRRCCRDRLCHCHQCWSRRTRRLRGASLSSRGWPRRPRGLAWRRRWGWLCRAWHHRLLAAWRRRQVCLCMAWRGRRGRPPRCRMESGPLFSCLSRHNHLHRRRPPVEWSAATRSAWVTSGFQDAGSTGRNVRTIGGS